ncbi:hypothetical protein [Ornithinimicrobium cavernae]|uniref:hypothetical protein n=1 Tax=Ornithinimicrobium cavernae TaxID=2666047 RepID=UPI000D696439|nr:hypothetical protein [Ornithinimicrobium cavernae]
MSPMVRLRPTARAVRRGAGEVQFGLSPASGIVLAGLTERETDLLLSLTGAAGTSRDASLARQFGVPLQRVEELVDTLRGHGLLVDREAPVEVPAEQVVCVSGRGTVVERLGQELRGAGVGRLVTQDDVRGDAGGDSAGCGPGDLAVVCSRDVVAPDEGRAWQRAGVPHLPVVLRDGEVVIGPLIHPGRSACLRCLDLHRGDRDHAWPSILTQLSSPPTDLAHAVDAPPAQAATIATMVTMLVLECVTAPGRALGVSWHVGLPWPEVHTRVWTPHPRCGCGAPDTAGDGAGTR